MKTTINKNFLLIILFVLGIRLFLAYLPGMSVDMNNWLAWSGMLREVGPAKFYAQPGWTDYTPGFLYYLWLAGLALKALGGSLTQFWVKVPIILADFSIGYLIYSVLRKKSEKLAILGFLALVFHPGILFSDSVFGQTDGLLALFLFLAAYFIGEKGNLLAGWISWGVALLIKPQAVSLLPILLIYCFKNFPLKKVIGGLLAGFIAVVLIGYPFFHANPLLGLPQLMLKMGRESTYTSFMAYNFWAWIPGMFIQDSTSFLGISYRLWGVIMWLAAILLISLRYLRGKTNRAAFYQAAGLSCLAFFLFTTRLHERYVLYAFPFLLLAAILAKSRTWLLIYFFTGLLSLLNIYYPYAYYTPASSISNQKIVGAIGAIIPWISVSYLASFFLLLIGKKVHFIENFRLSFNRGEAPPEGKENFEESRFVNRNWKLILAGILVFAFVTRVWNLGFPKTYYFDEVYHAFTAEAYARNDPKGYEWWNTPPEGFAYEWLHPPLAKLIQAGSIKLLGDTSFAWRFPGVIFACATILVLFCFGKSLFGTKSIGLIAAFLYAIDGLSFVQSRITMNDIYLAFFLTLAFFLFWRYLQLKQKGKEDPRRLPVVGLVLGLACATKWTGAYGVGIIGFLWFIHLLASGPKKDIGYLLKQLCLGVVSFILIPAGVYISSYLQFWLQGHTLAQFKELHNQIWWYQTTLQATHPYQSIAASWPILYRPVYYFADYSTKLVSNIYALGNPLIWWGGLLMVLGLVVAFIRGVLLNFKSVFYNPKLIILFGYWGLFFPWVFSPRCMFIYHYLPSIPFMCIAIAYVLRRNSKLIFPFLVISFSLFVYFYPHLSGLKIPAWLDTSYYWFSSWR